MGEKQKGGRGWEEMTEAPKANRMGGGEGSCGEELGGGHWGWGERPLKPALWSFCPRSLARSWWVFLAGNVFAASAVVEAHGKATEVAAASGAGLLEVQGPRLPLALAVHSDQPDLRCARRFDRGEEILTVLLPSGDVAMLLEG